ncbi:MAG: hypothetical protein LQ340_007533 [Diploschistes diacapsis]|nr:MAG: hypothetical protein LQ340_007533 [Diploschistes diacapsis]
MQAIDKPKSISSAQVLRELQKIFNHSKLFQPWIEVETRARQRESSFQRRRRKDRSIQVKVGHGGTLDPLATGVLIVGIGRGTKQLQQFLECTKCYDATLVFGTATDTYDITGHITGKSSIKDVSRAKVERALDIFKGNIMQRPPLYSALRIQGKRLYEYAREGKQLPVEIQERPVTVEEIQITEWLEATLPSKSTNETSPKETEVAKNDLVIPIPEAEHVAFVEVESLHQAHNKHPHAAKGHEPEQEQLPAPSFAPTELSRQDEDASVEQEEQINLSAGIDGRVSDTDFNGAERLTDAPIVKLRMTVTSGFYVRSLCHDLGRAVGSLGIMGNLTRVRQGHFELGRNVLAYDDLSKSEDIWGPKLCAMLEEWNQSKRVS